jgi:hypothetical protein
MAPPSCRTTGRRRRTRAFDDTMRDPPFLAETRRKGGDDAKRDALIAQLYRIPQDVVDAARSTTGFGARWCRKPCLKEDETRNEPG